MSLGSRSSVSNPDVSVSTCVSTSARKISDKIAMLYGGKIIWQGPVAEIDRSGNPYVDQFIHGRAEGPIAVGVK